MSLLVSPTASDRAHLLSKKILILGYGSQGRAQALNLRDSGANVQVVVRPGKSRERALHDGVPVVSVDAVSSTDVIQNLLPDCAQGDFYRECVQPQLKNQTLLFSHGFNVRFGLIEPPATCDVVLVAPKSPGAEVRRQFERGFGVPCLVAVHQDRSGMAESTALGYAACLGADRVGVLKTTFAEETETDLFGEQAVLCGGMTELVVAGFETLVDAGYSAEVAYFECLHELKLIVDLLYEGGLTRMHQAVSDTAKYGDLTCGPRIVDGSVRARMKELLAEIRSGKFAREWEAEVRSGMPRFQQLLQADLEHPIEKVGARLRALMKPAAPERSQK